MGNPDELGKVNALQVLRGLAALLVVAFHSNTLLGAGTPLSGSDLGRLFTFGHAGVEVFFVLSGFIICRAHWNDARNLKAIHRYVLRRVIRIYPIMILCVLSLLLLIAPLRWVTHDPQAFPISAEMVLASLTLMPVSCYYLPSVLWSLQNEIYFYVVFLLLFIDRRLFVGTTVVWGLLCAGNTYLKFAPGLSACASYPLSIYNVLFSVGVASFLAARVLRTHDALRFKSWLAAAGISAFGITAGLDIVYAGPVYFHAAGAVPFPISVMLRLGYGVSAFLMVTAAGLTAWAPKDRLGRTSILVGDASFAIYLAHLPVLGLLSRQLGPLEPGDLPGSMLALGAMVGASVALGLIVHVFVERPVLKRLRRIPAFTSKAATCPHLPSIALHRH